MKQAIAYIVDILPALGHLHELGLLYCDFKPDNVIQTASSLKLIDLGGVYRMDDRASPIYGTAGYQAREIAQSGPTVASDLFTVGRALAVLCTDFRGHQGTYRYTLPPAAEVPQFASCDSLYRVLERATAADPADRFQSADDMADQLLGVLHQVVSAEKGTPQPRTSRRFTAEAGRATTGLDWRSLPTPLVEADDPGSVLLASLDAVEPDVLVELQRSLPDYSVEVDLRLARALIDAGRPGDAGGVLSGIEQHVAATDGGWDWRVQWYRGTVALSAGCTESAQAHFDAVYRLLPGELAPKLALGFTAEAAETAPPRCRGTRSCPGRIPPSRRPCSGWRAAHAALGDRAGAIAAYGRIPATSSAHVDAQVAEVGQLLDVDGAVVGVPDVLRAAAIVEGLPQGHDRRDRLSAAVLEAALDGVRRGSTPPDPDVLVLSHPLTERGLRLGLEATYRAVAHHAVTTEERIAWVDRANRDPTEVAAVSLDVLLRCSRCGHSGLADDEFCEACGAAVSGPRDVLRHHLEVDQGTAAGVSDRGLVHRRNDDALFVDVAGPSAAVAVVCDGVSTAAAPQVAAQVAAEAAGGGLSEAVRARTGVGSTRLGCPGVDGHSGGRGPERGRCHPLLALRRRCRPVVHDRGRALGRPGHHARLGGRQPRLLGERVRLGTAHPGPLLGPAAGGHRPHDGARRPRRTAGPMPSRAGWAPTRRGTLSRRRRSARGTPER